MKIILAIFCGAVALFAGGCSLILLSSSGSAAMPSGGLTFAALLGGVALLNILVIVGLFGSRLRPRWAFYLLGGVDLIIGVVFAAIWFANGVSDRNTGAFASFWIGAVLLKGTMTMYYGRRL